MGSAGFLIGILTGIGILALGVIVLIVIVVKKFAEEAKKHDPRQGAGQTGFSQFKKRVNEVLETAPVNSAISATLPIPSVEAIVRVAGKRAGVNSYRLEIRLGYKRLDHLEQVETLLSKQVLKFERTDKGNGAIKLLSEKVASTDELLKICASLRSEIMFDLEDGKIEIYESIRSAPA